jgi:hypothetical protein
MGECVDPTLCNGFAPKLVRSIEVCNVEISAWDGAALADATCLQADRMRAQYWSPVLGWMGMSSNFLRLEVRYGEQWIWIARDRLGGVQRSLVSSMRK